MHQVIPYPGMEIPHDFSLKKKKKIEKENPRALNLQVKRGKKMLLVCEFTGKICGGLVALLKA